MTSPTTTSKTLMFGATGVRGSAVLEELKRRNAHVVAVARTDEAAAQLRSTGTDVVVGDLSTAAIPNDVTAIHVPLPAAVDADGFVANSQVIVDRLAGRDLHVVFGMPSIVPTSSTGFAVPDSRLAVTSLIQRELPQATIVTTTLLLENFSQALAQAVTNGALPYPIPPDVPVAWTANRDLADATAACILDTDVAGALLHFGGKEVLTGPELCTSIASSIGTPVAYLPISEADFASALVPLLGESVGNAIAEMTTWTGTTGAPLLTPQADHFDSFMRLDRSTIEGWATEAFAPAN